MRWTGTALWEGPSATPWVVSTIRVYPYNDTGASEAGWTELHACYAAREKIDAAPTQWQRTGALDM